jgi:hypothetical protein
MLQPEILGDVDQGTSGDMHAVDELGLTADERAAFDGMKEGPADSDGPAEPDPVEPEAPTDETATDPAAPPPAPTDEDDDTPDVITTDPKTGKSQKTINYNKHQRLMTKAQKEAETVRQQAEQMRVDNAKLAERLAILNEALMAPPPAAEPAKPAAPANPWLEPTVNPEENAIEALAQMQRRQAYMAESTTQAQEQTQAQLEENQIVQTFTRDVSQFVATDDGKHFMGPEGAYQALKNARLMQLGISLFDKDPSDPNVQFTQAEINRMVSDYNSEEKWVVSNAMKAGKSPAQAIMKLAKTFGWKAPTAAAPVAQVPAVAAPTVRAAAPAKPAAASAVAKLQNEIDGAAASRSLSDGGGSPPAEPLSAETLLRMNDSEFARYVDNLPKERLDAIMGRSMAGG